MKAIDLPIFEGHQPSLHRGVQNAQLVNFYIYNDALVPTAGLKKLTMGIVGEKIRASYYSRILDQVIYVIDNDLYSFDGANLFELAKDVFNGFNYIKVVENFNNQISFLVETEVYVYNTTTKTVTKNTEIGLPVEDIAYQDTYFFYLLQNRSDFKLSEQNDGTKVIQDFSGLANGRNIAIASIGQQIWVFTSTDINIFYDTGNAPPADIYAKSLNLAPNYGCLSKRSVAVDYGIMCWLATTDTSSPFIAFTEGGQPKDISSLSNDMHQKENIDYVLDEIIDPTTSIGMLYQLDGHTFYHLYFPSNSFGLIYDFLSHRFSKVTYNNYIENVVNYKNIYYANLFGKVDLYEFSNHLTEDDEILVERYVVTPTYNPPGDQRFGIKKISQYVETGLSEGGSCELLMSKDGGITFHEYEVKNFPAVGEFGNWLIFYQLGAAYWVNVMLKYKIKGLFAVKSVTMYV